MDTTHGHDTTEWDGIGWNCIHAWTHHYSEEIGWGISYVFLSFVVTVWPP